MKKQSIVDLLSTLILTMFLYAAFSKYFDWNAFTRSMYDQPFEKWFVQVLIIAVPPVEIMTAVLLMFERTRFIGMVISTLLMTAFTCYIALALWGAFAKMPCSCGGIIKRLSWKGHLLFNLFFLSVSVLGSKMQYHINNEK